MYHVSAQGVDERMINVHYFFNFFYFSLDVQAQQTTSGARRRSTNHRAGVQELGQRRVPVRGDRGQRLLHQHIQQRHEGG